MTFPLVDIPLNTVEIPTSTLYLRPLPGVKGKLYVVLLVIDVSIYVLGFHQWEDIEKLNFFPKLEEIRLRGIPLLQNYTNTERRSLMLAQ